MKAKHIYIANILALLIIVVGLNREIETGASFISIKI